MNISNIGEYPIEYATNIFNYYVLYRSSNNNVRLLLDIIYIYRILDMTIYVYIYIMTSPHLRIYIRMIIIIIDHDHITYASY